MPSSKECSQPRDRTQVSHIASGFFTTSPTCKAQARDGVPLTGGSSHGDFSEASNTAGGGGASRGPGEQEAEEHPPPQRAHCSTAPAIFSPWEVPCLPAPSMSSPVLGFL